jgi:cell division protein FtsI/penicillin-binding protein 2
MQADSSTKDMREKKATAPGGRRRELGTIVVCMTLVVVAFVALAGRCVYLQYARADHYAEKCLSQQLAYLPLEPQRGAILDCRGRVLAASDQVRTIFAEPRIIKEPKETSTRLAPILDIGAHEICRLIVDSNNPGFVALKTDATVAECSAARKIPGIGIQYTWRRNYPMGRLTSHLVGFTSVDNIGLAGLEYGFDRELRGRGALNTFFVDVHRRPLAFCLKDQQEIETPTHGAGIILTIDATIQQFAREALWRQYQEYQAEAATALVADPQTGAILAMVSLPDFDPAEARRTDPRFFTNRLLLDQFEPGSIIKPVVAAIALDSGAVNRFETIFCENGHYHGKGFGTIGEYKQGFGDLTVREILMNSSNIGMAKIGQRLGPARLYEGLTLFGFGKKVGLELPGEAEGLLRPPSAWTAPGYSLTRIAFGQEISVTAVQMLRAFCMLANGGRLVHPYLIKAMVTSDGMVVDMRPSLLRVGYVIKPQVAKWVVNEALTSVVEEGTGKKARLAQWRVFGKTGTGQMAQPNGPGYQENAYTASFIGGAPVEDPRVIVLVSIRRPNVKLHKGYTGGTVAAPVAAAILEKTLTYLEVPPQKSYRERKVMVASQRPPARPVDPEQEHSW